MAWDTYTVRLEPHNNHAVIIVVESSWTSCWCVNVVMDVDDDDDVLNTSWMVVVAMVMTWHGVGVTVCRGSLKYSISKKKL